jgi:hypothetical protein
MKTFLLKDNKPIIKWGMLPDETYFEGTVPEGYALAVCPSDNIVILDVDVKNNKNGFNHIPEEDLKELNYTFHYNTKSGGAHYFIEYTGNKQLMNTSTKYGLDLRIGAKESNAGGYVKYHHNVDIRNCKHLIKKSSLQLNTFLESLFQGVKIDKENENQTDGLERIILI